MPPRATSGPASVPTDSRHKRERDRAPPWDVVHDRQPGDEHARRRQHALDAEIDHADEDDDRLAAREDDQEARARQQSEQGC